MISLLNNLRGLEGPTKLFSLNNSFCGGIDLQQSPYQQPTTSIVGKSHYFIKTLFMQPKLLGFRVSQHQQTRFSDITEEIEIATMFKDLTSWYCNFLSISDEIFNPFFENMGLSIFFYTKILASNCLYSFPFKIPISGLYSKILVTIFLDFLNVLLYLISLVSNSDIS